MTTRTDTLSRSTLRHVLAPVTVAAGLLLAASACSAGDSDATPTTRPASSAPPTTSEPPIASPTTTATASTTAVRSRTTTPVTTGPATTTPATTVAPTTTPAPTTIAPTIPPSSDDNRVLLTKILEEQRAAGQFAGARMALFDTDGTVTDVAVGTETLDGASPAVDLETPWGVGSVTKVFMSTVVLQLVEEGLLDVDEPVAPYVPQLVDGDRITVRHLLQHTSGLNDFLHQPPVTADATREWTTAEMLAVAEAAGRTGEPGATHHYSNTNYILLGDVVEQVTGHDWFDEVRSRIIEPLGLRHTGVVGFDEAPGYVMAGGALVVPPPAHPSLGGSSGGMQSTPADLLVFIRAVADGTLLTSESQALMRSWVPGDDLSKFGLLHRYGLGLESYSNDSITVVGHLGNGHAHSAFVGYDADRGTAVVVTLNANNPGAQALMALDALLAVARSEPVSVP